jgi:hypothetical protein
MRAPPKGRVTDKPYEREACRVSGAGGAAAKATRRRGSGRRAAAPGGAAQLLLERGRDWSAGDRLTSGWGRPQLGYKSPATIELALFEIGANGPNLVVAIEATSRCFGG